MPELPDILGYLTALEPRVVGQRLESVRLSSPFLLRSVAPPLREAEGRRVVALRRIGKRIVFALEGDLFLVLHLMVSGRLHWRKRGAKVGGRGALAAFDFPDARPPTFRYVGPQLDDPAWAARRTPLDDDRPVVLVAMSTPFMEHVDQLQRAVTPLGTLPVKGLVTTGPAIDPDRIDAPAGLTVVRSAPHREVLAHTDVLLTHGGHGTVMKGLVAGVPIVCMPTGRDQPDNAARLVHRGAGLKVSKRASPARIAAVPCTRACPSPSPGSRSCSPNSSPTSSTCTTSRSRSTCSICVPPGRPAPRW